VLNGAWTSIASSVRVLSDVRYSIAAVVIIFTVKVGVVLHFVVAYWAKLLLLRMLLVALLILVLPVVRVIVNTSPAEA
jgi:hypothetical protein